MSMAERIGAACRDAREAAGRKQLDIAHRLEVSEATISRFENGRSTYPSIDDLVGAYASELRVSPDTLWRDALDRNV